MQKQYRLKSNGSFRFLYRKGTSAGNKSLVLLYAKSTRGMKIGLSVSKHVGNAVTRNHVKRLLRENLRHMIDENKIDQGYTYVLIAKPDLAEKNYESVGASLVDVFKRAEKLKY